MKQFVNFTADRSPGEWWQDDLDLLYLRARWYSPGTGTFLSVDPVESEPPYQYVGGNVVNRVDPSGYISQAPNECNTCQHDARDLTDWLIRELNHNISAPETIIIGTFNTLSVSLPYLPMGPGGSDVSGQAELVAKATAYAYWTSLVKNNARWDFKQKIKQVFEKRTADKGESIFLSLGDGSCGKWFDRSVPGNIHYGYIGLAAQFMEIEIHGGASVADIFDPNRVKTPDPWTTIVEVPFIGKRVAVHINPSWSSAGYDDPTDYEAIQLGIDLYKLYGKQRRQIIREEFQLLLRQRARKMDYKNPPVDAGTFSDTRWPYPVGFFNGPVN